MKKLFTLIILSSFIIACTNQTENKDCDKTQCCTESTNDHLLFATLYQQYSPEYKALCMQTYQLAATQLENYVNHVDSEIPPAVVLDLDETVLDNSPFEAKCVLENTSYPTYWEEWMNEANADLVPGSKAFLAKAKELGVEIYYISNRKVKYLGQTIQNMNMHQLPNADSAHIWLRTTTSSKKARRDSLSNTHDIVMLIGDNLNDFTEAFELEDNDARFAEVKKMDKLFGRRFIMLPNPMYGEWEKAALNGTYEHERTQRDSLYRAALKAF